MRLMIHPAASQRGDREESVLRPPMRPLRSKVKSGRSVRVKLVLVRSEIPGAQLQGMHGNPKWPVVRGVLDVQNSAFKGDGAERSSRLAGGQARRQQENHAGTKTGHGGDSEYTCEMAHLERTHNLCRCIYNYEPSAAAAPKQLELRHLQSCFLLLALGCAAGAAALAAELAHRRLALRWRSPPAPNKAPC
ncbi:Protein of unknown function [Gryllus bimaculatus]|nr:Protein of unknown function [Gryllus bimaculatus]